MIPGIVYFIQPQEYIGTNIYKFGCSRNAREWTRLKSYGTRSRIICVMECVHPFIVEARIKKYFVMKYQLERGREYFRGDESAMLRTFTSAVHNIIDFVNEKPKSRIFIDLTCEIDLTIDPVVIDLSGEIDLTVDPVVKKTKSCVVIDITNDDVTEDESC